MTSKILNFPDAMKLALVISKHYTPDQIKIMTGQEFAIDIFTTLSEKEIIELTKLEFTDKTLPTNLQDVMIQSIEWMMKNSILDLLSTHTKLGYS